MKAIIDATDSACIIRIYGTDGALCDIHVVEEVELRGEYRDGAAEMQSNGHEDCAACRMSK